MTLLAKKKKKGINDLKDTWRYVRGEVGYGMEWMMQEIIRVDIMIGGNKER